VRFISGVTKSPELAAEEAKEKAQESQRGDDDKDEPVSGTSTGFAGMHPLTNRRRSSAANTEKPAPGVGSESDVIDRAERSRERASRELDREDARPPQTKLTTARSPSAERGDPGGFTLPVVEEGTSGDEREGTPPAAERERRKEQ
jgi:1-phosphatidylinositol-4-phosphate 5-kinase